MTEAPERIWALADRRKHWAAEPFTGDSASHMVEYVRADLARPVTVAEAAKVLLDDRFAGYGNRKAMKAMWNHVYEMHGRHMLPQSHYDGVLQAALRALSHEGGE